MEDNTFTVICSYTKIRPSHFFLVQLLKRYIGKSDIMKNSQLVTEWETTTDEQQLKEWKTLVWNGENVNGL